MIRVVRQITRTFPPIGSIRRGRSSSSPTVRRIDTIDTSGASFPASNFHRPITESVSPLLGGDRSSREVHLF